MRQTVTQRPVSRAIPVLQDRHTLPLPVAKEGSSCLGVLLVAENAACSWWDFPHPGLFPISWWSFWQTLFMFPPNR
jgi:hypothetical protein